MRSNIKLFCFPYAGGSASVYQKWSEKLSDNIKVIPVELPGRGIKFNEKLETNFDNIIDILYSELISQIDEKSLYAFWGHSMGSIIEFFLTQRLMKDNKKLPVHIFFSGQVPPQYMVKEYYYQLPDDDFLKYLDSLGGMPCEIMYNQELRRIFLPIIRSDMIAINSAELKDSFLKMPVNITILYGDNDISTDNGVMNKWCNLCSKNCELEEFSGDHFFINQYENDIISLIEKTLKRYIS